MGHPFSGLGCLSCLHFFRVTFVSRHEIFKGSGWEAFATYDPSLSFYCICVAALCGIIGVLSTSCLSKMVPKKKLVSFIDGAVYFVAGAACVGLSAAVLPLLFGNALGAFGCMGVMPLCDYFAGIIILVLGAAVAVVLGGIPLLIATCRYFRSSSSGDDDDSSDDSSSDGY